MNNWLDHKTIAKVKLIRIVWVRLGLFYGYKYGFQPGSNFGGDLIKLVSYCNNTNGKLCF